MTIEIRYFSKTGNTAAVATKLADLLGLTAQPIDTPLPEHVDLLLYGGGGVYMTRPNKDAVNYLSQLDPAQVSEVALFGTAGSEMSGEKKLTKALADAGIKQADASLFLHGIMPSKHNFSDKQWTAMTEFAQHFQAAAAH